MRLIGRINNVLYHYLDGARIIIESTLDKLNLSDVINYSDVKSYSNLYFIDLAIYGESQYNEVAPVTDDDKEVFNKRSQLMLQ